MEGVSREYPRPDLQLSGEDGNAFSVMARARKALREAGYPQEKIDEYLEQCRSGDYNNLVAVTMRWFKVS